MIAWRENLISDTVRENWIYSFSWENGIKTSYDLQSYWTSMVASAILALIFSYAEWVKFLLQIYIKLTGKNSLPY
jgi:hypothetical protein